MKYLISYGIALSSNTISEVIVANSQEEALAEAREKAYNLYNTRMGSRTVKSIMESQALTSLKDAEAIFNYERDKSVSYSAGALYSD